jgi:hypothetical protein
MGSTNYTPPPLKWLTPPLKKIWRPRLLVYVARVDSGSFGTRLIIFDEICIF